MLNKTMLGLKVTLITMLMITNPSLQAQNSEINNLEFYQENTNNQSEANLDILMVVEEYQNDWKRILLSYGKKYKPAKVNILNENSIIQCKNVTNSFLILGATYCPIQNTLNFNKPLLEKLQHKLSNTYFKKAAEVDTKTLDEATVRFIIAKQMGQHIQNNLGITKKVEDALPSLSVKYKQEMLLRTDLQTDCFAGIMMRKYLKNSHMLEKYDVEGILFNINNFIIKEKSNTKINSTINLNLVKNNQHEKWVMTGLETEDLRECDSFSGNV